MSVWTKLPKPSESAKD